ncbi:MAG: tail fiber domain-containing protein [Bacteroidota bacterium]
MKTLILVSLMICLSATTMAQVAVNTTGAAPATSAMLDVVSSNKGILFPRVALTGRFNAYPVPGPVAGLVVYNTAYVSDGMNTLYPNNFYYWNGSSWDMLMNQFEDNVKLWSMSSSTVGNIYERASGNVLIGPNGTVMDAAPSAKLEVRSTDKGVLFPQVSIDSLKDITSVANPANGLVVYNTTQPGARYDMMKGYYYYDATALKWVRLADNQYDNQWQLGTGGYWGVELKNKNNGVDISDPYNGAQYAFSPKVKIAKIVDSLTAYSLNVNALVLSGTVNKVSSNWINHQKTSIVFENNFISHQGWGLSPGSTISSFVNGTTINDLKSGLNLYTFATPAFSVIDTPTISMVRRNVAIGGYAVDNGYYNDARLSIPSFKDCDNLNLSNPVNSAFKWAMYVDGGSGALNFYRNNSLMGIFSPINGAYTNFSDSRMKKDVEDIKPALSGLLSMKAYSYRYVQNNADDPKTLGFMAQDVLKHFPELVSETIDRESKEKLYLVNYSGLGVVAVKAIQEQQAVIASQQKQIDELKAEIKEIRQSLLKK